MCFKYTLTHCSIKYFLGFFNVISGLYIYNLLTNIILYKNENYKYNYTFVIEQHKIIWILNKAIPNFSKTILLYYILLFLL